jgi:phosphoribosylformylglycinamidine synthase
VLFKYSTETGEINNKSNPNGSLNNIAGVCNEGFNVFGMMPHPERAAEDFLLNQEGLEIIHSIIREANLALA